MIVFQGLEGSKAEPSLSVVNISPPHTHTLWLPVKQVLQAFDQISLASFWKTSDTFVINDHSVTDKTGTLEPHGSVI